MQQAHKILRTIFNKLVLFFIYSLNNTNNILDVFMGTIRLEFL